MNTSGSKRASVNHLPAGRKSWAATRSLNHTSGILSMSHARKMAEGRREHIQGRAKILCMQTALQEAFGGTGARVLGAMLQDHECTPAARSSELGRRCFFGKALLHALTDTRTIWVKIKLGCSVPDRTFQQPHTCIY